MQLIITKSVINYHCIPLSDFLQGVNSKFYLKNGFCCRSHAEKSIQFILFRVITEQLSVICNDRFFDGSLTAQLPLLQWWTAMDTMLFSGQTQIQVRALFVAERLLLKDFEKAQFLAKKPLLLTAGSSGCAALFRYGVVVTFGLTAIEETALLDSLKPYADDMFEAFSAEEVVLSTIFQGDEKVEDGVILLHDFCVERLQLIAEVLARSIVLERYEAGVAKTFQRIEPLAEALQQSGRPGSKGRDLLRHIGDALFIQGRMVGRVEIIEKPDLLWNYPEHQRLYEHLTDEYELSERHNILERKLDLISRTAETLLGMLQNKRSLRVEWYITILIVFEILLTLYEMFIAHSG